MQPDPAWAGPIAHHELLFGTWLAYIAVVLIWQYALRSPLAEWKYAMLVCIGASFFVINHYFNFAPFYLTLINSYTVVFLIAWWRLGMRQQRTILWKISALLMAVLFSIVYIAFEMLARQAISFGLHQMWITIGTFLGFAGVIFWRQSALAKKALKY